MNYLKKYWSDILIGLYFVGAIILFCVMGEDSYIAIHDNLDLFQPQFKMMKDGGLFFAHNAPIGFLGGISRDVCASEWSLTSVLYMILPPFGAYIAAFILKTFIGLISGRALAYEVLGSEEKYYHLINLCAFAYGLINFFPCFGIPFAAIPLVVWILIKIEKAQKNIFIWYIALFTYPFISYFSYLGFFILAYMVVAFIWISIVRKRIDIRMLLAIPTLGIGYVAFEYRLFSMMLLSDEVTIRSTMVLAENSLGQAMREAMDVFMNNSFHADALTGGFVMPVCLAYFLILNARYISGKNIKGIFHDVYNLILVMLVFDSLIYGLYTCSWMRDFVEKLVPPLTGFQFDRTSFFNPFLWVCALFVIGKRMIDLGKDNKIVGTVTELVAYLLVVVYVGIILVTPTRYNDLRATGVNFIKTRIFNNEIDDFSYREFYGVTAYDIAKEDIGYDGEWSVAYGFYPAQLEYNGINTLDGYLGFYSQEYKEDFRKIIAPALDRVDASRYYYDNWGARAYLFSGDQDAIVSPTKSFEPVSTDLYIDVDAFREMGGKYVFSRFELTGEAVSNLAFRGSYQAAGVPYTLYVYDAEQ